MKYFFNFTILLFLASPSSLWAAPKCSDLFLENEFLFEVKTEHHDIEGDKFSLTQLDLSLLHINQLDYRSFSDETSNRYSPNNFSTIKIKSIKPTDSTNFSIIFLKTPTIVNPGKVKNLKIYYPEATKQEPKNDSKEKIVSIKDRKNNKISKLIEKRLEDIHLQSRTFTFEYSVKEGDSINPILDVLNQLRDRPEASADYIFTIANAHTFNLEITKSGYLNQTQYYTIKLQLF